MEKRQLLAIARIGFAIRDEGEIIGVVVEIGVAVLKPHRDIFHVIYPRVRADYSLAVGGVFIFVVNVAGGPDPFLIEILARLVQKVMVGVSHFVGDGIANDVLAQYADSRRRKTKTVVPGSIFVVPSFAQMSLIVGNHDFQFWDDRFFSQRSKGLVNYINSPRLNSFTNDLNLISLGALLANQKIEAARRATGCQKQNYQTGYKSHWLSP